MSRLKDISHYAAVICLVSLTVLASLANVKPASAGKLSWTIVDTPSTLNNVRVSPSEVNFIAIGSDDHTFYAVDIPDTNSSGGQGRLYKSLDGGVTWQNEFSPQLIAAGASMPVWSFAIAPDDVDFIVAVTDGGGLTPSGPKQVYISTNGGAKWDVAVTGLSLNLNELISCVDVSITYGGTNRDVAIGTRDGNGTGRVWALKAGGGSPSWKDQGLPPSDVVAIKFSPTYASDDGLVVVSSDATGTSLHLGDRDTASNTTPSWDVAVTAGYPVLLWDPNFAPPNLSPDFSQIITADLELPSDFSAQDTNFRRSYVNIDATPGFQAGVYRVDDSVTHRINPPTGGRISSIAYLGTYSQGILLAGEVTADQTAAMVPVWRTSNCTASTPSWLKSDMRKSPTGGVNSALGNANAQLSWNANGTRAYCGTSSACLGAFNFPLGAVDCTSPAWPEGYLKGAPLDESAFSVSPYSLTYNLLLTSSNRTQDTDVGNVWNQLSLIDTEMDILTDVAALEAPVTGGQLTTTDYDVLYVFSSYENIIATTPFNSLWRSTSDPLGRTWERVLCVASGNETDTILRVKQTTYEETERSRVIVFSDVASDRVGYSANEGQTWNIINLTSITDLALASDTVMYVLNDTIVYRYELNNSSWVFITKAYTELNAGHTIAVPLKNPKKADQTTADMVAVGEVGPPDGLGRIAYVDFSQPVIKPEPDISARIAPPVPGDAHVIFDDKFEQNNIIYNATTDSSGVTGKIYRWIVGKSTTWDELEPPNNAFYGLVQRNSVLYGAWRTPSPTIPAILANTAGVDRTLYPRANVPPPLEWDYLVAELPTAVLFTHEPSSLKVTSNQFNTLWALDNNVYDFEINKTGLLWEYTDTPAKVGPTTTSPPSGSDIPVDPKSGRAEEINFAWRQLSYSSVYELQLAKDADFYNRVLVNEHITPVNQLSPTVFTPAGALIPASGSNIDSFANLESGHTYYWRVRARAAVTGDIVRSPWSATMYFTVEAGLPTASPYPAVTLFSPTYGSRNVSISPGFSWSGMPKTTEYEFVLARDPAMQQVIVKVDVPTTSYLYDGKLDYNTTFFWQVRALEPVVSDASPTGTFTVMAEPKPVTPEVVTPAPIPSWVWWIIAIFTALVVAIIAFAMVKPGYIRPSAGGKLINIEPIAEKSKEPPVEIRTGTVLVKSKNFILKIWNSIVTAAKRQRFFRKRAGSESKDSQEKLP